jgi:hypothetical protein
VVGLEGVAIGGTEGGAEFFGGSVDVLTDGEGGECETSGVIVSACVAIGGVRG